MIKEWKEWLESPVRVDHRRKIIEVEAPPPAWYFRVLLAERLHDTPGCLEIISALVKEGCDGLVLTKHLEDIMCSHWMDRWKKLAGGLRPRDIRAAVRRMRKCAAEIEALNSGLVTKVYIHLYPGSAPLLALPSHLRMLAGLWELLPKRLGHVRPDSRKRLMEHVIERTGKFHYEEMASVIGAASGSQLDAVALRMYCSKQGITRQK
jgi:hypothetical protein